MRPAWVQGSVCRTSFIVINAQTDTRTPKASALLRRTAQTRPGVQFAHSASPARPQSGRVSVLRTVTGAVVPAWRARCGLQSKPQGPLCVRKTAPGMGARFAGAANRNVSEGHVRSAQINAQTVSARRRRAPLTIIPPFYRLWVWRKMGIFDSWDHMCLT